MALTEPEASIYNFCLALSRNICPVAYWNDKDQTNQTKTTTELEGSWTIEEFKQKQNEVEVGVFHNPARDKEVHEQ